MPDKSKCWACNNMDGYWEEKARREAAEKDRLKEVIERPAPLGRSAPEPEGAEDKDDPGVSGATSVADKDTVRGEGV